MSSRKLARESTSLTGRICLANPTQPDSQRVDARGLLALLLTPLTMPLTRGNVRREAEWLKRRCEQRATPSPE